MKKRKRPIFLAAVMMLAFAMLVPLPVFATDAAPPTQIITVQAHDDVPVSYSNNMEEAVSRFLVSDNQAIVKAECNGLSHVTSKIKIEIKLERKILFWWFDVENGQPDDTWTDIYYASNASVTHTLALTQTGSYRATFTYTVSGNGGSDDVITTTLYYDYK